MAGVTLIDKRKGPGGKGGNIPAPTGDDEPPVQLYAKRKQIYPKLVHGRFRTLKWAVLILALGVYYGLPWIRWDRGPDAANQAVLADFAGGRFYFFGIEIWPQEVYYITGLLILAALGLFLVTALFGRVWCGYACPQTVWTDLFLVVERAFEGDRSARMRLDRAPWSFDKAWRKVGKHIVWLLIAFATGGAFILYWHDAPSLARTFFAGQASASAYIFAGVLTFTTYALAGSMREQVCTYMCPWPRIQSALIDKDTVAVTYRSDRGDPRGPHRKGESWEGRGDCIDCKQCVQVCPQGIDIRQGLQLECIHCALCIDACDEIMKKVGRPTGLIAYDTDENVVHRWAKQPTAPFKPFRARTILYMAVMAVVAGVMVFGLATRSDLGLNVLKDRSLPFVRTSDGEIRNGYTVKLVNKAHADRVFDLTVEGVDGLAIQVIGDDAHGASAEIASDADGVDRHRVLVTAPLSSLDADGSTNIRFVLTDKTTGRSETNVVPFIGPEK
ncbi:MAG: cytochrome c oxidase accessory protein CcoG [Hyphomonadaceae bacterium]